LIVPLVATVVDHLSLEVDDGSGFDNAYWEPTSSHSVTGLEDKVMLEVAPNTVPVSAGGVGEPPPTMLYATPREYWL
jgi:hypothetical protein